MASDHARLGPVLQTIPSERAVRNEDIDAVIRDNADRPAKNGGSTKSIGIAQSARTASVATMPVAATLRTALLEKSMKSPVFKPSSRGALKVTAKPMPSSTSFCLPAG
jgi:hypothetical protein